MDTMRVTEAVDMAKKAIFEHTAIQCKKYGGSLNNIGCMQPKHDGEVLIAIATLAGAILIADSNPQRK